MTPRQPFLSAVHLFLERDGRVLLLRRFRTGYEDGKYSVVAGHLEGKETVVAAAVREAREEVGLELSPQDIAVVGVMHRLSNDERIDWFTACGRWSGEPCNNEPDHCDELRWVSPASLPDTVIPYVRRALENYRAGRWFDTFGFG